MTKLFIIPTSLANSNIHAMLASQISQISHLQHFIVETPKVARSHLKTLNLATPLQELTLHELNKHHHDLNALIKPLLDGTDVGLLSDCGMPAIADPGSSIIALAHKHQITVVPLVGPCSLILALASSGVNGQTFAFQGYLPINKDDRIKRLQQLQQLILSHKQTQIMIEAPFRNQDLLQTIIDNISQDIIMSIAINLMTDRQQIMSKSIKAWSKLQPLPDLHRQEVVFVLGLARQ